MENHSLLFITIITKYNKYNFINLFRHVLDSVLQTKQQESLKGLVLLLYTAAVEGAQPFFEVLFSTSAGRIVLNCYKGRPHLPEDFAEANGHDELAQYLRGINTR